MFKEEFTTTLFTVLEQMADVSKDLRREGCKYSSSIYPQALPCELPFPPFLGLEEGEVKEEGSKEGR